MRSAEWLERLIALIDGYAGYDATCSTEGFKPSSEVCGYYRFAISYCIDRLAECDAADVLEDAEAYLVKPVVVCERPANDTVVDEASEDGGNGEIEEAPSEPYIEFSNGMARIVHPSQP